MFPFLVIALIACQPHRALYQLYDMDEFDITAANGFLRRIEFLDTINEISIVDTRADGNDFVVNRQLIFLDTSQQDKPNYYNYVMRARELGVPADSLLNCLRSFYRMGVNEFNRDSGYYRFPVTVGLNTNEGYVYSGTLNLKPGDTLRATSVRNKEAQFKVVLTRQADTNWFAYFRTR